MSESEASAGVLPLGGGPRVVVVGNLTIDDVVHPDGSTQMGSLGGNCVHSATAALACGAAVSVVTRRGEDFPSQALEELRAAGIDLQGVVDVPGPTVRNWVIYEPDGRRHWVYRTPPGRSAEVAPVAGDIPAAVLAAATVVHVAAMPIAHAEAVVQDVRSRAPGMLITLDTHEDWVGSVRERLITLARDVDVFVPSLDELEELTGVAGARAGLEALRAEGLTTVVAKAGADGAYVLDAGGIVHVPAVATTAVDTTGAGDAFCGGLTAGLAQGHSLVEAVAMAAAVAATAIASTGSLRLLRPRPTVEAVDRPEAADDGYAIDVMRREIAMIPDVVARAVDDPDGHIDALAQALVDDGITDLWLTGCGDSAFAGQAAALAFQRHTGLRAHPVHALDLARYRARSLPPGSAVVAVSFSGQVGRTTEAAIQTRRFGHPAYALTNAPDGPLARASDVVVPLEVVTLGFSPGTSTYIAMLTSLLRLAAGIGERTRGERTLRRLLDDLPARVARTLELSAEPAVQAAGALLGAPFVTYLGAGPNEATARFGAAKLFEGPQQLAVSTNLEEWAHEEYFVTGAGDPVVLVNPHGAAHDRGMEILSELRFVDALPIVVSDAEPTSEASEREIHLPVAGRVVEELSPVTAALPLALAGFHLARLAGKRSYNFPSEAARTEHYDTIHRVTVGEPA